MLQGNLNAIAYMPLKNFSERINGMPDYKISDLKKITEFRYLGEEEDKEQEKWFWEIMEEGKT